MKRRDALMALLAVGVTTGAMHARAQQAERVRRIGVLMGYAESDPEAQLRLVSFRERLAALGWMEGRNLSTAVRWGAGDADRASTFAKELVALKPEVILANTTPVTAALQRETRSIPIVFTVVSDPVGSGFVKSLARPEGNITGLINLESGVVQKQLELLKEIAPQVTRVAVMFNPRTAPYVEYYLRPLNIAAQKLGVTTFTAHVQNDSDIESAITGLARERGGGVLAMTDSFMTVHRKSAVVQALRSKVPLIYFSSAGPADGGLISYGVDVVDLFRRAAPFVDRILRGAKPAELPVEQPTKFELVINRKTAKLLGIAIPQSILLRADRVIE